MDNYCKIYKGFKKKGIMKFLIKEEVTDKLVLFFFNNFKIIL